MSWTDDFNRGSGIGPNWTGSAGNDLAIAADTVVTGASAGLCSMYWNANIPNQAQYAQAVILGTGGYRGPVARASATDWVGMISGNNEWTVAWYNGGAYTQIGSIYAPDPAIGDLSGIRADGANFEGLVNGVVQISGSNGSAPATGYTGLMLIYSGSEQMDDFEGGDLAAPPPPTGYRNIFGEERIQVALFETGNSTLDSILADWFFGASAEPGFVDLAAAITGVQANQAALQLVRNLTASIAGVDASGAALGVLRNIAAVATSGQATDAQIGILRGLTAALAGTDTFTSELPVLRNFAATITGQQAISAGLQMLVDLAAGIAGSTGVTAAESVYRGLAAAIAGASGTDGEIDVARALSAAAASAMQIYSELITGHESGAGHEEPITTIYLSTGLPPLNRPFVGEEDALILADDEEVLMLL
jgi:hypothetical protein